MISQGILSPTAVAISGQLIVWTDERRDTVEAAALDGTGRRVLRRISHSMFIDIALFQVHVNNFIKIIIIS